MRTAQITKMIRDAVADETRSHRLRKSLEQTARQRGVHLTEDVITGVVKFVREYVEHAPLFMEQGQSAAQQAGLGAEMGLMLQELESYWFEANDLVPDHLGLVGLTDDAYATLSLLQAFSDYCQATHGRPLLQQNLTAANRSMREFIGDPVVSILDQRVGITLANSMTQRLLGQVVNSGFSFPAGPDPIWGNASIDEIVTARMGALGIV